MDCQAGAQALQAKRRYNHFIPYKVDRWLRFLRYSVLRLGALHDPPSPLQLIFAEVDPIMPLFNLWSSEVAVGGLIVLGIVSVASLFVERPFCKYACPYGWYWGFSTSSGSFPSAATPAPANSTGMQPGLPDEHPGRFRNDGRARSPVHFHPRKCTSENIAVAGTVDFATVGRNQADSPPNHWDPSLFSSCLAAFFSPTLMGWWRQTRSVQGACQIYNR